MSLIRWMAVGDLHGEECDRGAVNAARQFMGIWKPQFRIALGDIFDFTPLRKGATEDERRHRIKPDVDEALRFFGWFSPNIFLRGNHDERLWDLERSRGPLQDLSYYGVRDITLALRAIGCRMLPYDKDQGVFRYGDCNFIHGYYCGKNAAHKHASTYGKSVFAHCHAENIGIEPRWGGNDISYGVGCLCNLHMHYNRGSGDSLRSAHGWAYGVKDSKTGKVEVFTCHANERGEYVYVEKMGVIGRKG